MHTCTHAYTQAHTNIRKHTHTHPQTQTQTQTHTDMQHLHLHSQARVGGEAGTDQTVTDAAGANKAVATAASFGAPLKQMSSRSREGTAPDVRQGSRHHTSSTHPAAVGLVGACGPTGSVCVYVCVCVCVCVCGCGWLDTFRLA